MAGSDRGVITAIKRLRVRWRRTEKRGYAAQSYTTISLDVTLINELATFGISAKDRAEDILCSLNMKTPTGGPKNTSLSRYVQACLITDLGNLARHYQTLLEETAKAAIPTIRIKRNGTVETTDGQHLGHVFENRGRWYAKRPGFVEAGEGSTRKEAVAALLKVCKRQKLIPTIPPEYTT